MIVGKIENERLSPTGETRYFCLVRRALIHLFQIKASFRVSPAGEKRHFKCKQMQTNANKCKQLLCYRYVQR